MNSYKFANVTNLRTKYYIYNMYITWYHKEAQQLGNKQNQRVSSLGSDWLNAALLTLYNITG